MVCPTPVVFVIFRRPAQTARVFDAIREAKPTQLLVVADGPRNEPEAALCQQARAITESVDWDCEVLRDYSSVNLGCQERVRSGLDWAFRHVEEAIILEDDCLPHPSFFQYCESLLSYYRSDERVMVVSGNNFQNGQQRTDYSYYFSKYNHCWGWATWKRAWDHWSLDSQVWIEFRDQGLMSSVCSDPQEAAYWSAIFDQLFLQGTPDTWDYPWTFACWLHGGLSALPNVNLVSNIGFGADATHTKGKSLYSNMPTAAIDVIRHPPEVVRHAAADQYTYETHFGGRNAKERNKIIQHTRKTISYLRKQIRHAYKSFN